MKRREQLGEDFVLDEAIRLECGVDPRKPTSSAPGTIAKVAVLALRVKHGLPLWRNDDLCWEDYLRAKMQKFTEDIDTVIGSLG